MTWTAKHAVVICPFHGRQGLTERDYDEQMDAPDSRWRCPVCLNVAEWDDDSLITSGDNV